MATGPLTQINDVIVPSVFAQYVQNITTEKSRLIQSGALVRDPVIDGYLAGEGLTFNARSFRDLDNDEENTSRDDAADKYTGGANDSVPFKTGTFQETAIRLSRNNSWSSADLINALISADPMSSIQSRLADYWTRRLQRVFISAVTGLYALNESAASGTSTHTQNDMTNNISGAAFSEGVTNFTAPAFIDALVTMGDSSDSLGMVMVHSIVEARMMKNDLIKYRLDSEGRPTIPTFLGRDVIVDDAMPNTGGVFQSWIFGAGALRLGMGSPKVPVEIERHASSGNGGGSDVLHNRIELCIHPEGHQYKGSQPNGGPNNTELAEGETWSRIFPERKQIKMARLVTREY